MIQRGWCRLSVVLLGMTQWLPLGMGETVLTPRSLDWARQPVFTEDVVTHSLQVVNTMAATQAEESLEAIDQHLATASDAGRPALALLRAVALEQMGAVAEAREAYRGIATRFEDTPYGTTAGFSLNHRLVTEPLEKNREKEYVGLMDAMPRPGWFLIDGQWSWSTTRDAACHLLIDSRSNRLSFRFLDWLRSHAPFETHHAYVFILLILAMGAKIIQLPLLVKTAVSQLQLRALLPEITVIQHDPSLDALEKQQALAALYKRRGIGFQAGCAVGFVDFVFVVWALIALNNFAPRLSLDGARFFWLSDVTRFSWSMVLLWFVVTLIATKVAQPQQPMVAISLGLVVTGGIIAWIAKAYGWPAHLFMFWTILTVLSTIFSKMLQAVVRA